MAWETIHIFVHVGFTETREDIAERKAIAYNMPQLKHAVENQGFS
jgi:hypothetical protein